jgi:hypothetical protein
VETLDEGSRAKRLEHVVTHSCHDAHAGSDIGRVGQLDADLGHGRPHRAHAKRDDEHGSACTHSEAHGNEDVNWRTNKRNPLMDLPPFLTRQSYER